MDQEGGEGMCTTAVGESIKCTCERVLGFGSVKCLEIVRKSCQSDCVKPSVLRISGEFSNVRICLRYMIRPFLNVDFDDVSRCSFKE